VKKRHASLDVAARVVAPFPQLSLSPLNVFDTTFHQPAFRPQAEVCYRFSGDYPVGTFTLEECNAALTLPALFLHLTHCPSDALSPHNTRQIGCRCGENGP
jgi:hypothetical protein